jgi:hypothetical protein
MDGLAEFLGGKQKWMLTPVQLYFRMMLKDSGKEKSLPVSGAMAVHQGTHFLCYFVRHLD